MSSLKSTANTSVGALVSIVIPCFNAEKYVDLAIRSALDQTWPNKEVIVVDDGSTDRSAEIIRNFGPVVRADFGPNRGGCAARNRGLALSRGHWIQFLDADDIMLPDCIERKMAMPGSPVLVGCCAVQVMASESSHPYVGPKSWFHDRYDLEYLLRTGSPQTSAPLHRRELLESIGGFREGLACGQEYDLHLRMAIQCGIGFLSSGNVGVLIRPTPGSVSRSSASRMALGSVEILMTGRTLLAERGLLDEHTRFIIANRVMLLARQLWRRGLRKEASDIALRIRKIEPKWYLGLYRTTFTSQMARALGFDAFERVHDAWRLLAHRKP